VGRGRDDRRLRLWVFATNQRDGRVRAGFGEDLVGLLLIRSDVPFTLVQAAGLALCAFQY